MAKKKQSKVIPARTPVGRVTKKQLPPIVPPKFKKITRHTMSELEDAVQVAVDRFGRDFWLMLHGVDAYMERRKRMQQERYDAMMRSIREAADREDFSWGKDDEVRR